MLKDMALPKQLFKIPPWKKRRLSMHNAKHTIEAYQMHVLEEINKGREDAGSIPGTYG